jgi:hypothetical protein
MVEQSASESDTAVCRTMLTAEGAVPQRHQHRRPSPHVTGVRASARWPHCSVAQEFKRRNTVYPGRILFSGMVRGHIAGLAFAAATLAGFSIFLSTDSARAQATGGQVSPTQSAPSTPSSSSLPAPAPITGTPPPTTSHSVHTVTVTFDYDFSKTRACTAAVTKHCVMQFIAYDISAGARNPVMLFPIPLPTNPIGAKKGITSAGPPLDFESGKHLISVSAMSPDGTHSGRSLCTTWITIP